MRQSDAQAVHCIAEIDVNAREVSYGFARWLNIQLQVQEADADARQRVLSLHVSSDIFFGEQYDNCYANSAWETER